MSTLWTVTHFLERKDWYLCFAGGPLKKILRNLTRVFCEAIANQRRIFKIGTGEGFYENAKGFWKTESAK